MSSLEAEVRWDEEVKSLVESLNNKHPGFEVTLQDHESGISARILGTAERGMTTISIRLRREASQFAVLDWDVAPWPKNKLTRSSRVHTGDKSRIETEFSDIVDAVKQLVKAELNRL